MAVRDDFAAGEVLAAADLNDTFSSKLDTTGGTIETTTGSTTLDFVSNDSSVSLNLNTVTVASRQVIYRTNDDLRWIVRANGAAETGSDAGSDFQILSYGDTGSSQVQLEIGRDNSLVKMQGVYDNTTATAGNVNVTSNGALQRSTSSIKYKTNVESLENEYADKVLDLRPVWYRSTVPSDNPEWSHYGLIAEEVAEVDPRLVQFAEQEDGTLEPEGVQYDRLVPHLINIVQRQQAQIDALTARLDAAGL